MLRLVLGKGPTLIREKQPAPQQGNAPHLKKDASKEWTKHCWVPTFFLLKGERGGWCAWLMLRCHLTNTDVQPDEGQPAGQPTHSSSTAGQQYFPYS